MTLKIIIDAVRECVEAGMTAKEAGESIGLSAQTMRNIARDSGCPFPHASLRNRPPSERDAGIAELFEAGATLEEIGSEFGITRERVRQLVKRMGYKPRQQATREFNDALCSQIVEAAKAEWLTCRELAERFGVSSGYVWEAAESAGLKLPTRTLAQETLLSAQAARVAAGESIHSVCGKDHPTEARLGRYLASKGIKSCHGRHRDFSHRHDLVAKGRLAGLSWGDIASQLASIEGLEVSGNALATWAQNNMSPPPVFVAAPRPPRPAKEPRKAAPKVVAVCPNADVIIKDTVRETAVANRGRVPASAIAKAIGVTRNSIIGHWNRSRLLTHPRVTIGEDA